MHGHPCFGHARGALSGLHRQTQHCGIWASREGRANPVPWMGRAVHTKSDRLRPHGLQTRPPGRSESSFLRGKQISHVGGARKSRSSGTVRGGEGRGAPPQCCCQHREPHSHQPLSSFIFRRQQGAANKSFSAKSPPTLPLPLTSAERRRDSQ